jgi:hypothetical protein
LKVRNANSTERVKVLFPNETIEQAKANRPLTWNTGWTVAKVRECLDYQLELQKGFLLGTIKPSKIIGGGYKSSAVARRLAGKYLVDTIAQYEAMLAELILVDTETK